MLDTLNSHFAPQFREDPPRYYHARVFAGMEAHRLADGYRLELRTIPDAANISIAAAGTYENRIAVPNASRLWAISATSALALGFDLQLRNPKIAQPLFDRRAFYANASGQVLPGDMPTSRLFILPRPLLVFDTQDGAPQAQLLVQIWNRAAVANSIQVVLWFQSPSEET
jgi:hypothetical protein